MRKQLEASSCAIEPEFFAVLLKNKIVKKLGNLSDCEDEVLFVGDVFLHPEPEKRRWRLIFHPRLYNLLIRQRHLQHADLPRLRHIVKGIVEHTTSVKLDLKCAFFQVPVEKGIFCFRHGSSIYTLTRLPMGASTSVIIAQELALAVMNEMNRHLERSLGFAKQPTNNAFVDDIFLSSTPTNNANETYEIMKAMEQVSRDMSVTFKTCHFAKRKTDSLRVEDAYKTVYPKIGESTMACCVEPRSKLEVLGVIVCVNEHTMDIKDSFKSKAREILCIKVDVITPLNLWKVVGTCVHVIYALGLDNAKHFWVFRLLGRIAHILCGADKSDPRWSTEISLSPEEQQAVKKMISDVLIFPTVKYLPPEMPNVFAFTDASDLAAGVVIFDEGRVTTMCFPWNPHEASLDISAREALAAWLGTYYATLGKNRFRTPLLAIDNTTLFFGIINGMSSIKCANTAIRMIRSRCQVCLMWLPTESMPADLISRLQLPQPAQEFVKAIYNLMGDRWGNYFVVPRYSA